MNNSDIKIGIVGAGAIGSVFAAFLTRAGFDVEIVRYYDNQKSNDRINKVNILGELGETTQDISGVNDIDSFSSPKDFIFIMTKAYDNKSCVFASVNHLNKNGKIVLLQNYCTIFDVMHFIPISKIIGFTVEWTAIRRNQNTFEVIRPGIMRVGAFSVIENSIMDILSDIMSYICDVYISTNILGDIYSRLILNSCVGGVGALCGDRLGIMLKHKNAKKIFTSIIREAVNVANRMNLLIENYNIHLNYYKMVGNDPLSCLRRKYMYFKLAVANPYAVSSVLRAIENKKRSEIEYLNGIISQLGEKWNISTKTNSRIVEMVHEIESGERSVLKENLLDKELLH